MQVAGIFDNDDPAEARAKLVSGIAQATGPAAAEEHAPHLAMLLGLGREGEVGDRETLFFSARVFVESLALDGPTMLLYDDIHWADASLLDLLHELAARVRDVPVLFVALARPELLAERPGWGGGLPAYTALQLEPLSGVSSRELATALLAESGLDGDQAELVTETAEGNPLFIEELSAAISEKSADDALPTSIREIVAARLDSLPSDERSVLVDASVVGRVFWRGALLEIASRDDLAAFSARSRRATSFGVRQCHACAATSSSRSSTASSTRSPTRGCRAPLDANGTPPSPLPRENNGGHRPDERGIAHHWQEAGQPSAPWTVSSWQPIRPPAVGQRPRTDALLHGARLLRPRTILAGARCGADRSSRPVDEHLLMDDVEDARPAEAG